MRILRSKADAGGGDRSQPGGPPRARALELHAVTPGEAVSLDPVAQAAELRRVNEELQRALAAHAAARSEAAEQAEILDAFFRHTQTCLVLLDRDFNFIRVNEAYAKACHRDASEFVGRNHFELYPSPLIEDFRRIVAEKTQWSIAARPFVFPDHPEWGTTYWDLALVPILDGRGEVRHLVFSLHDVTPIIRAEAAVRESEAQFRQAQKMESIGRLAGGVAHDFNNLLCVVNGSTAAVLEALGEDSPVAGDLRAVLEAGERAALLTRQLLAFGRQQLLQPTVVVLNRVVAGMEDMLRRVIGEDIELSLDLSPGAGSIKVDAGQLEQVVMNLVVNARDAMPAGGHLAIQTTCADVPAGNGADGTPSGAGRFARLTVTDTGRGMDDATMAHIFEPFFTTKEKSKGTGMGLATVHGIVHQSGGFVRVTSDRGKGSSFEVYLPAVEEAPEPARPIAGAQDARGSETILVVEDEAAVRNVVERTLARCGYRVLSAANGVEALRLCEDRGEPVDLLLTDVVMPRMGGPELARRLTERWPALKILFMSGYVGESAPLEPTAWLVCKPMTAAMLREKVRARLDHA